MSDEFRKIKSTGETRFVLEFSDAGAVTSSGSIASIEKPLGELQRRAEPPKPRNFVAKNAKMGGAGQHKDKKKAAKQGDVKHKKPLAESYAEDLAKQVFDANPNINDENAVLDAAWPIVVQDLGKKTAMSMFNYDEDFPSDLVSVYDWLQKNQQGVAEGFNGEYDDEAGMAHSNLLTSARAVQGLLDTIEDRDNLPEWAQEKIAKAEMMLVSVWDYLQSQKEQGIDPQIDMEEGRSYHDNRTGFSRGPRDDERHDLDVPSQDPREFRMYNLTVDGKPLNPQPIMGRSNLIKFGKQQAAAGVDLSNAIISLVDENVAEVAPKGWEGTVKAMKKHKEIDNPYALTNWMKNKGYQSHKKEDAYMESLAAKLANKLK